MKFEFKNRLFNVVSSITESSNIYSDRILRAALIGSKNRNFLLHIAMPKSGTTWFSSVFNKLYNSKNWKFAQLVPSYGTRPQEIDPRYFFVHSGKNVFFRQQHCVWSKYTEEIIKYTNTKIIFQYRNIPDAMISLRDHFEDALFGSKKEKPSLPKGIYGLKKSEILDYVLEIELPWFCKFLDGWLKSDLAQTDQFYALRYEHYVSSQKDILLDISKKFKLPFNESDIQKAIASSENVFTRKNVGVVGRSKSILNKTQIKKIMITAKYFNLDQDLLKV